MPSQVVSISMEWPAIIDGQGWKVLRYRDRGLPYQKWLPAKKCTQKPDVIFNVGGLLT